MSSCTLVGVITTTPSGQPCWLLGNRQCDLHGMERGLREIFFQGGRVWEPITPV